MEEILGRLKKLPYDALQDWIDVAEYQDAKGQEDKDLLRSVRLRRRGKEALKKLQDLPDVAAEAMALFELLPAERRRDVLLVAKTLAEALKPQAARRGGEGFIQVKAFRRYKKDKAGNPILDEQGQRKFVDYGPYLYLRLWLTGGDWDSKKQRLSSVYLGGKSSEGEKTEYPYKHLAEKLRDSYEKKGNRLIRTAATEELESRIKACVDISTNPPSINHEALEVLEKEARAETE